MKIASTKLDPESDAILGKNITGDITSLNLIQGEIDNINIEIKVFGKEIFESTKTSFKIITLKVTD